MSLNGLRFFYLEKNVWRSFCVDVVEIEKYTVKDFPFGIVLKENVRSASKTWQGLLT
ncbi:hypothetical protein [Bacillus sp. OK048]|uniref:hypothetical protein n=1 Tax=Bacillus sp. OK048 TaxID=1882761 RepID=UPI00088D97FA|nr:hypothetical protein [Bacillus sp. OK048]SDN38349.1 hypothetical protein SAMN05443253_11139 [Bacillus sp. OK048]